MKLLEGYNWVYTTRFFSSPFINLNTFSVYLPKKTKIK